MNVKYTEEGFAITNVQICQDLTDVNALMDFIWQGTREHVLVSTMCKSMIFKNFQNTSICRRGINGIAVT